MNFCSKCGSTVMPNSNVCPNCGEQVAFMNNTMPQMMEQSLPIQEVSMQAPQMAPMPEVSAVTNMQVMPPSAPEFPQPETLVAEPVVPAMPVIANEPVVQVAAEPITPSTDQQVSAAPVLPATPEVQTMVQQLEKNEKEKKPKKEKVELSPEEKEKKFNKIITITIIAISIIAMVIMAFFMYKALFVKEETRGNEIKNATQYSYEGFEFFLPEGTVASVEKGLFVIKAKDSSWSAIITIQEGSYDTLVSNKSQISGHFEELGYVSGETVENEVSGMGFVTTEVLIGSQNVLVAYAKASGTKVYGIIYINELGTYDNYSLKTVGEILASSINSGEIGTMPAGFTIEMFEQTFSVAR